MAAVRPEPVEGRTAALLALVLILSACGDTLVDHRNVAIQDTDGDGSVCGQTQVSCQVAAPPALPQCFDESATHCGADCIDCTAGFTPPHASAVAACAVPGAAGSGTCDYQCTGGFLKCPGGCCQTSAVAAGARHTCAITSDGGVSCWGDDAQGQVSGQALQVGRIAKLPVRRLPSGVAAIAAGEEHTCVALADEVRCWGRDLERQAPPTVPLQGVTALAAGVRHTCALAGSSVTCWGNGQGPAAVNGAAGATSLAAGRDHTCALLGGGVRCWGANGSGQLGNGTQGASAAPVTAIASGMIAVAAGGDHTCAATEVPTEISGVSDAVRCWGDQPGATFGLPAPQLVPGTPMKDVDQSVIRFDVLRLATGRTHVCVHRGGVETIKCFGPEDASGQLGGPLPQPPGLPTEAIDLTGTAGALAFAAGGDHSCAVLAAGTLWCWGSNAAGQLGDGTTTTPGVAPDTSRTLGTLVPVGGR